MVGRYAVRGEAAGHGEADVTITHARPGETKLRSLKGINLPDTRLRIAGLTPQDQEDLRFIARHADGVMAERAECVMLNKGPYIIEAIRTLDDPDPEEMGRAVGLRQGRWE